MRWDERDGKSLKCVLLYLANLVNTFRIIKNKWKLRYSSIMYVMLYFWTKWCFQPSPPPFFQLSSPCLQFVNLPYIWMAFFSGSLKCQKGYFKGKWNQTLQHKEYKWGGMVEDFIYTHTTGIFLNLSLQNTMCCCSDMIAVNLSRWYLKCRWCDPSAPVNSQAIDLKSTY